jgi:hypothetical protein
MYALFLCLPEIYLEAAKIIFKKYNCYFYRIDSDLFSANHAAFFLDESSFPAFGSQKFMWMCHRVKWPSGEMARRTKRPRIFHPKTTTRC